MTTTAATTIESPRAAPISFKNVLCAMDFSRISKKALAYAAAIARADGGKLHIVHVLPEEAPPQIPLEPLPESMDRARQQANTRMNALGEEASLADVPHDDIVERGPMHEVIADVIRRKSIDLLVLGTHGREGLNKLLLGSVAEDLFRSSLCPVLTVGIRAPEPPQSGNVIRNIVFPTDFSDASVQALPCALALAAKQHCHLILLHVITPKPVPPHPSWEGVITLSEKRQVESLDASRRLDDLIPADKRQGLRLECLVLFGSARRTVLDAVSGCRPDLVVMGLKGLAEPRAAAHLYWSTAHYLVCRAQCPILTIRGTEEE